ncbi:MAG: VTT domain-containing protein [Proteobacteria bacterium]|nr:VTT domain-containing protein [Pseudomonadota bacterium]
MTTESQAEEEDPLALKTLFRRLVVGFVVLMVGVGVVYTLAAEPLAIVSEAFVENFGILGVFVGCLLIDATPGLTHEPVLLFALDGGLGYGSVLLAAGSGSVLSGVVGYAIGNRLGGVAWVQRMLIRYRLRAFLHRYGVRAVAIAALTPFPFAIATWGAGASQIPIRSVLIGALFRFPKVLFYLSGIAGVLSMSERFQ